MRILFWKEKKMTRKATKKVAKKTESKGVTFSGPAEARSAHSKSIAGVAYNLLKEGETLVLHVNGQSGELSRFVVDSEAAAKTISQLIEDGKVLL